MSDILITPNRGSSNAPTIQFSGSANASASIRLEVLPEGQVAFLGKAGSLFSISDNMVGSLMAVSDISGLPILEVFSDDKVVMGKYNKNTLYVSGTNVGVGKVPLNAVLDVSGSVAVTGSALITGTLGVAGTTTVTAITSPASTNLTLGTGTYGTALTVASATGAVTATTTLADQGGTIAAQRNGLAPRQGLAFDGTASATVSVAAFGAADFTVGAWITPENLAVDTLIFSSITNGFALYLISTGALQTSKRNIADNTASSGLITAGNPAFVAYVRSATTGTYYINGVSAGTTTDSLNYTVGIFYIGTGLFPGKLAPLAYNRALSAAEVLALYRSGAVAALDYNEASQLTNGTFGNGADPYTTFSGASATGFTAAISSATSAVAASALNKTTTLRAGQSVRVTVNVSFVTGSAITAYLHSGAYGAGDARSNVVSLASGSNTVVLTANTLGAPTHLVIGNNPFSTATSVVISGVTITPLGALLAPDAAQVGAGLTWYDVSGNAANITLPATGVSWSLPTSGKALSLSLASTTAGSSGAGALVVQGGISAGNTGSAASYFGGALTVTGAVTATTTLADQGGTIAAQRNGLAPAQGLNFDGTAWPTLSIPAFGTADFSISIRANVPTLGNYSLFGGNNNSFGVLILTNGTIRTGLANVGDNTASTGAITAGRTYVLSYVRSSTTGTYYIDGAAAGTTTDSRNYSAVIAEIGHSTGGFGITGSLLNPLVFNRALSAAEVLALYRSGAVAALDYNEAGQLTNGTFGNGAMPNDPYTTFSGASATGFTAAISSATSAVAASALNKTTTLRAGQSVRVTVNVSFVTGSAIKAYLHSGAYGDGDARSNVVSLASGSNTVVLTANTLGAPTHLVIGNNPFSTATSVVISGVTITPLGALLAPDAAQVGAGLTWYDVSGNAANITLPATGVSWSLPTSGKALSLSLASTTAGSSGAGALVVQGGISAGNTGAASYFGGAVTAPSLTAPASIDLTLAGGSSGASLVLGQGANGIATLTPAGTGYVRVNRQLWALSTTSATGISDVETNANSHLSGGGGGLGFWFAHDNASNRPLAQSVSGGTAFSMLLQPYGGNVLIGGTSETGLTGAGGLKIASTTAGSSGAGALVVQGGISAGQSGQASYFGGAVTVGGGINFAGEIQKTSHSSGYLVVVSDTTNNGLYWDDSAKTLNLYTASGAGEIRLNQSGAVRFSAYGAGTATFDSSGNITSVSDARLKNITGTFTKGLAEIVKLTPKLYTWKPESGLVTDDINATLIAQDLIAAGLPEAVSTYRTVPVMEDDVQSAEDIAAGKPVTQHPKLDADGKAVTQRVDSNYSVSDRTVIAALVNAVKELKAEIDALKAAK